MEGANENVPQACLSEPFNLLENFEAGQAGWQIFTGLIQNTAICGVFRISVSGGPPNVFVTVTPEQVEICGDLLEARAAADAVTGIWDCWSP